MAVETLLLDFLDELLMVQYFPGLHDLDDDALHGHPSLADDFLRLVLLFEFLEHALLGKQLQFIGFIRKRAVVFDLVLLVDCGLFNGLEMDNGRVFLNYFARQQRGEFLF